MAVIPWQEGYNGAGRITIEGPENSGFGDDVDLMNEPRSFNVNIGNFNPGSVPEQIVGALLEPVL